MAAKPDTKAPAAAQETPKPAGKKKLVLIVALAAFILAACAAGALLLLKHDPASDEEADAAQAEAPAKKSKAKAKDKAHGASVYTQLETFTVNLAPEANQDKYLQTAIVLEVADAAADALLKANMPLLRNEFILALGSRTASQALSIEGRKQLAEDLKTLANKILQKKNADKNAPEDQVESVLFTTFIVQ